MDAEPRERRSRLSIAETICEATAHAADDLDLRGIALFTESGATARQLSKYHPTAPIFALSPVEVTVNRLNLLWGTTPIRCPKVNTTEAMVDLPRSCWKKAATCARARSSPLWPARAPNPAPPTSCACT